MDKKELEGILSTPWLDVLDQFIESREFDRIIDFIKKEKAHGNKIVPRTDRIFTALNKCAPDKIKVVMGLQDPYNSIEPDGLAMSCSLTGKLQPSLKEVYREIRRTVFLNGETTCAWDNLPSLEKWAEQGVFLINASLTVRWKEPNSHKGLWTRFIDEVFHEGVNKSPHPIVYILLGKEAQEQFSKYARLGDIILTASHPASVAYSGGIWDCQDVFKRANRYLEMLELEPIKW